MTEAAYLQCGELVLQTPKQSLSSARRGTLHARGEAKKEMITKTIGKWSRERVFVQGLLGHAPRRGYERLRS